MYGIGDDIREYRKDIEKLKRALELCKAENKLQRETIDSLNKIISFDIDCLSSYTHCPKYRGR